MKKGEINVAEYNRATQHICSGCGNIKEKTAFILSLNPYHSKYLPLCKSCISARLKEYRTELKSDGAALWCVCAEMGYPLIREYYDIAIKNKSEGVTSTMNLFSVYHTVLKQYGVNVRGIWQSDMLLTDFIDLDIERVEDKPMDLAEQEKIWGKFDADDYTLLNGYYDSYTRCVDNLDYSLELRYRDVAKGELRLRKANESGDVGEIDKAQKNLKSLLDMLGLNDYGRKDTDERKQFIDRLAWMIEETEPAEEEDEQKYKDIAGFEKAFDNIMRSMKNLNNKVRVYPPIPEDEQ